ncbi:MAG: hypothetical protein AB1485_07255 [Candidatus Thermoplasmatota archaeon]
MIDKNEKAFPFSLSLEIRRNRGDSCFSSNEERGYEELKAPKYSKFAFDRFVEEEASGKRKKQPKNKKAKLIDRGD